MVSSVATVVPAVLAVLLGSVPGATAAYEINTKDNIIASARTLAFDLMSLYKGNQSGQVPGLLSDPPPQGDYYWFSGGGFLGAYVDYWRWTGDASYNEVVTQGLLHQVGEGNNYMPANYTAQMGNDDQCLWGLSAMLAAEHGFPNPPQDKPQWLALAKAVFEVQAERLQAETECSGGLRWIISPFSKGYDYKNTVSNGCFLNLGARLARYTGNFTYARYVERSWAWLSDTGFIDNETWAVYDGARVDANCSGINKVQFSYPAAIVAEGAAFMANLTDGASVWRERTQNLSESILSVFFPDKVAFEAACEQGSKCTTDMVFFKGYLHRFLAVITQLVPTTAERIFPVLRQSTEAAVGQCTGGSSGRQCGFYWSGGKFVEPGTAGVGEQLNVLSAVSSLLVAPGNAPGTASAPAPGMGNGGSSGLSNGGSSGSPSGSAPAPTPSSAARCAQGFMPVAVLALAWWILVN